LTVPAFLERFSLVLMLIKLNCWFSLHTMQNRDKVIIHRNHNTFVWLLYFALHNSVLVCYYSEQYWTVGSLHKLPFQSLRLALTNLKTQCINTVSILPKIFMHAVVFGFSAKAKNFQSCLLLFTGQLFLISNYSNDNDTETVKLPYSN